MSSEPFSDKVLMKGDLSDSMATEAESETERGRGRVGDRGGERGRQKGRWGGIDREVKQ